eukprot:g23722.t1
MIYLHSNHESCLRSPPDTATARFHSYPEPALGDLFNGCCSMGEAGAKRREAGSPPGAARNGDTACSSLAPPAASSFSSSSSSFSSSSSSNTGSPSPCQPNTNTSDTSTSAPGLGHQDGASPPGLGQDEDTGGSDPEVVESPGPPPSPPAAATSSTEPRALEEFTDVSLKARNSFEGNRRQSAPEQLAAGLECPGTALGNEQGAKPKKLGIADYIS